MNEPMPIPPDMEEGERFVPPPPPEVRPMPEEPRDAMPEEPQPEPPPDVEEGE
jgi:hypothetical protein